MAKKYKVSPGTWIERETFESKAFLSLRGFAPQLLILMLSKRQFTKYKMKSGKEKRICTNCDSLNFTYTEAQKYGKNKYKITIPRLKRAFNDLLEKGFIRIIHQGGAYKQDKSIYGLSDEWVFWQPGANFNNKRNSDIKRGFQKCGSKQK
jgi:hypothetical protein